VDFENNQQQVNENMDGFDFKAILYKYLSYWHFFAASFIIAMVAAYAFNRLSTPRYRTEAKILISAEKNTLNPFEQNPYYQINQNLQNEIGKLTSRKMIEHTLSAYSDDYQFSFYKKTRIQMAEIYRINPYDVVLDTSHVQGIHTPINITFLNKEQYKLEIPATPGRVLSFKDGEKLPGTPGPEISKVMFFGQEYTDDNYSFKIFLNSNFREDQIGYLFQFKVNNLQDEIDRFRGAVKVEETGVSSIVNISFVYPNERKAIDFINRLAQTFIQDNLADKNFKSESSIRFIDTQLESLTDSLDIIENRLQNFKTQRSVMDISKESSTAFSNYYDLRRQRAEETVRKRYYDYLLEYVEKNEDSEILAPSGLDIRDELLVNLINELNQLYADRSRLLVTTKVASPSYKEVENKILRTKQMLKENITNIVKLSEIKIQEFDANLRQAQAEIDRLPETERQLVNITRKFTINDDIYTFLLQKRAESAISKASNAPDHKVLESAITARMVYPTKALNYLVAFILAIIVPLILIFFRDFMNDKIYNKRDIQQYTRVPIIGMTSHSTRQSNTIVLEKPKSIIAETFRSIRTNLQFMTKGKPVQVIAVTSTISGEGKTFCSINLASVLALSGKKTLILGCDLRKPKIFADFNLLNDVGVTTYLIGKSSLDEIIQATAYENLHIIVSGPVPPNPSELLETPQMGELLETLKGMFDYIVIDTPPIGLVSDAVFIMRHSDASIYVARQGYTPKQAMQTLNDLTSTARIENLSILVNDVDMHQRTYGRYYGGGYGYGYSYGYGYGYGYGQYHYLGDDKGEKSNWFANLFK
jgi:tyrosine-protein kinase Etk/Wzc